MPEMTRLQEMAQKWKAANKKAPPQPVGAKIEVEIEPDAAAPGGAPPSADGFDAAKALKDCADEFGMEPAEVMAEFKEFLAQKKAGGAGGGEEPMELPA